MSASTTPQSTQSASASDTEYSEPIKLHHSKGRAPRQGVTFTTVDGQKILAAKIKKIVVHDTTPDEQSAYEVRYVPAGKRHRTKICWVNQHTAQSLRDRKELEKLNREAEAYE